VSIKGFSVSTLALVTIIRLSSALAADDVSVDEAMRELAAVGDANCPKLQQQVELAKTQASPEVISGVEAGYRTMCVCMPAQLKVLRSKMSPTQLNAKASLSDLQSRYMTEVVGKCGGEQLRSSYGEGCAQRFAKVRPNSEKYCRCMSAKLAKIPDAEVSALGLASAEYTPKAAEAQKKGLPPPEPEPALKRYLADDRACSTP
jgi:hypothetical protein